MSKQNIRNIILDAGHGGINAQGLYTTLGKYFVFPSGEIAYEGVINRAIVSAMAQKLRLTGKNVVFTVDPANPKDISLKDRVLNANKYSAQESVFVSIHNNASGSFASGARGFEIFTTPGQNNSDKLADEIYKEVAILYNQLGLKLRSDISDGDYDKEEGFYVLKGVNMPAVLVECLFFDNYEDYKKLKDSTFISQLAQAISKGITNYITTKQ